MKRSVGALLLLRLLDQLDHAGDRVVGRSGRHAHAEQAVAVDRAGEHRSRRGPCGRACFRR